MHHDDAMIGGQKDHFEKSAAIGRAPTFYVSFLVF